jgi:hypothetical protein
MGFLSFFYPWSLIFQAAAVVHYYRTRPAQYWIYVIIFLGPLGAIVYLVVVAGPDIMAFGGSMTGVPRKKRIAQLEIMIRDNPSAGNLEELGDVYLDIGDFSSARAAYDKAIAARGDSLDLYYHRAICAIQLGDIPAAVPDLESVVLKDPAHDFHRAVGLLAHACALTGQKEKAQKLFEHAIASSTLSETYLNYADLLASEGRVAEARQWAQKVLDKQQTMPPYLRRREQRWFRDAAEMLKKLAAKETPGQGSAQVAR